MRSIKPGRGPSAMGAVGSAAIGVFGIFWTISAANMGAPVFCPVRGHLCRCRGCAGDFSS